MRRERLGPCSLLGVAKPTPPTALLSRRVASGAELVPPGGAIVAANHISLADPVVIYPEGTVTLGPDRWPMQARTGVARLALLSGAPVVPMAQWGAQDVLDTARGRRISLRPRRLVRFRVGPPVDLSRWTGREPTAQVVREVTTAVMDAVTAELEVLRGERAPAHRYDPRRSRGERRTA